MLLIDLVSTVLIISDCTYQYDIDTQSLSASIIAIITVLSLIVSACTTLIVILIVVVIKQKQIKQQQPINDYGNKKNIIHLLLLDCYSF